MAYQFLPSSELSSVWEWAKKLITDLNANEASNSANGGVPVGATMMWHEETPPQGWLLANGQTVEKKTYPLLFLIYGYRYGGSDDLFALPDYRNRIPMGAGVIVSLNDVKGADAVTLTLAQLAPHSHDILDPTHTHAFTGIAHGHGVTDPQHAHGVTDPGHSHVGGAAAAALAGTAGGGVTPAATANAVTGLTVNAAATGVTVQPTVAGGTNTPAATGVLVKPAGEGKAISVLNPVFGINVIVKV